MSLKTIAGRLDDETLARLRALEARKWAIEQKPEAFSPFDAEEAYIRSVRLLGEIAERFELDPLRWWNVDERTGYITYSD